MRTARTQHPAFALLALAMAATLVQPAAVRANDDVILLNPPPIIRKFPQFNFCPFPVTMSFVASGATATIQAIANTYVDNSGTLDWTKQGIDNVVVVTQADYNAHLVPNDGDYNLCYAGATVPNVFNFDQEPIASAKLYELFTAGAIGWDLSQGAAWDGSRSADNDPSNTTTFHNATGGFLALGLETATPSLADTGRTSIQISGLTSGQTYVVTGWWTVAGDGIQTDDIALTIKVLGPGATELSRRTWGFVKTRYR